jgi:hypothetical protein
MATCISETLLRLLVNQNNFLESNHIQHFSLKPDCRNMTGYEFYEKDKFSFACRQENSRLSPVLETVVLVLRHIFARPALPGTKKRSFSPKLRVKVANAIWLYSLSSRTFLTYHM